MKRELTATTLLLRRDVRLALLNIAGYAALILAGLAWLWIPDSHLWEFLVSAVTGPAMVSAAVWLQLVTMARWNGGERPTRLQLLKHFPGFLVWIAVAWGASLLIGQFNDRVYLFAGYLASRPAQHVRYLLSFPRILWSLRFAANAVTYYLLPIILLPLLGETAARGIRQIRWRLYLSVVANWRFWLMQLLLVSMGVWAPAALMDWTPGKRLAAQVLSVGLRLLCAYLMAVTAWLVAVAFVGVLLSAEDKGKVAVAGT